MQLISKTNTARHKTVILGGDKDNWYFNVIVSRKYLILGIPFYKSVRANTFETPRYSVRPDRDLTREMNREGGEYAQRVMQRIEAIQQNERV